MELFKTIVGAMAYASLAFSATSAYLRINKLWIRKHHPEVADSISIASNVMYLIPLSVFTVNYAVHNHWQGVIDGAIWLLSGIISILIGSRLWVLGQRNKSFRTRVNEALRLERSEVGDLAKSLFGPASGEIILEIFAHFVYIDRELEAREQEFIQTFADSWHIDIDWNEYRKLADLEQPASFMKARDSMARYLKTSPPRKQVAQLRDVLHALVQADDRITSEEELLLKEVDGLIFDYVGGVDSQASYTVVVAPQNPEQDSAIATLLPHIRKSAIAGGSGYRVGAYYSKDFANVICDQYRALGFFTVDVASDGSESAGT